MVDAFVDLGGYFSVSGHFFHDRKKEQLETLINAVPPDRLLVETDSPYLAPVPHRGKPNRPAYVVEVLERVAEELDLTPEACAEITTKNFFRLFERAAQ